MRSLSRSGCKFQEVLPIGTPCDPWIIPAVDQPRIVEVDDWTSREVIYDTLGFQTPWVWRYLEKTKDIFYNFIYQNQIGFLLLVNPEGIVGDHP